jgi:hypothetical protein
LIFKTLSIDGRGKHIVKLLTTKIKVITLVRKIYKFSLNWCLQISYLSWLVFYLFSHEDSTFVSIRPFIVIVISGYWQFHVRHKEGIICLYEKYILLLVVTIKRQKIICLPFIINNMFCLVFKIILHYYLLGLELEFHIPTFCMILLIN